MKYNINKPIYNDTSEFPIKLVTNDKHITVKFR